MKANQSLKEWIEKPENKNRIKKDMSVAEQEKGIYLYTSFSMELLEKDFNLEPGDALVGRLAGYDFSVDSGLGHITIYEGILKKNVSD